TGLWNRDVCEIFIAPDRLDPNRYFEFEVAPTGEWVDLAIRLSAAGRESDPNYFSGIKTAAQIEKGKVTMAMKIGWTAFGKTPSAGDIWLGNVFRCVGSGATRGYLSWQPTKTELPNFHVPSKFGSCEFVK
ncbi:MAG: carbohydrate-binding family 9-like protein, partial [Pyrinomonadaceae bacterium]